MFSTAEIKPNGILGKHIYQESDKLQSKRSGLLVVLHLTCVIL